MIKMSQIPFDDIEQKANEVLNCLRQEKQFKYPVPVKPIAKIIKNKAGMDLIRFCHLHDHHSGKIEFFQNNKAVDIYINPSESIVRQRFTLFHELGHCLLHKGNNGVLHRTFQYSTQRHELEANHFAACILMPKEDFIEQYKVLNGNLTVLARLFNVSRPAVAFRADYLFEGNDSEIGLLENE